MVFLLVMLLPLPLITKNHIYGNFFIYIYGDFILTFMGILFLHLWELYFDFYRNFVTLQYKYY